MPSFSRDEVNTVGLVYNLSRNFVHSLFWHCDKQTCQGGMHFKKDCKLPDSVQELMVSSLIEQLSRLSRPYSDRGQHMCYDSHL